MIDAPGFPGRIPCLAIALFLAAIPLGVVAGSLKVVPIRVSLDDPSATAVLTLTNQGQDRITVQLDAKAWDQDDQGADRFSETSDVVFFPRMLELEPEAQRIIRIGFQGEFKPVREKTYRIFLQELPVAQPGVTALRFAVTLSIPVFVRPGTEISDIAIAAVTQEHGRLRVEVRNDGNAHVMVGGIRIRGLDAAGHPVFSNEMRGWYLLADSSRSYELPVPQDNCSRAAKIGVEVQTGRDTVTTGIDADASLCGALDKSQGGTSDANSGQDVK
jgi:fimbrial chaperone protein